MGERSITRALVVTRALSRSLARRAPPSGALDRILVAHNLMLGDVVMLTPLLAKLRANHPLAQITLLMRPPFVPLYEARPYAVRALPFTPSDSATARALLEEDPFDLAVVVGDNRYSWLAKAMRARRVVAHSGDTWTRNLFVDEERPYSREPATWGDMVAGLVDGNEPPPYARGDWPAPAAKPFERPAGPYAVLHVGASTPLKFWLPSRWMELAASLERRGMVVVWSAGRGEESVVGDVDPARRYRSYAGALDLAQLWHLIAGAQLLVAPDTGVAHLGRAAWTPTVALFGPGSASICGPGDFWRETRWQAVTIEDFPCRDQKILFRREIEWVRRCHRTPAQCAEPRCMHAIEVGAVLAAIETVLG